MTSHVTIVVPVYRGLDEVTRCIESVLAHVDAEVDAALLVIDDASPEPDVAAYVRGLPSRDDLPLRVEVHRNDTNRGFAETVNDGMSRASGDVVILNADTVVTAGWLARLADAARERPDVATVTPLTNFGSICTLPRTIIERFDLDGDHARIDECGIFVAEHGLGLRPSVISGVGFCMYVTRAALDRCGDLDAETFGRGYGEEVDFCLRATGLGFLHLVEDRTFVHHRGGVSFGADGRAEGLARGSAILHDRYPAFRAANRAERRSDPLRASFAALGLGLVGRDESRPHVLHLLHSPPGAVGGTEKHLHELMRALLPEFDFSILYPGNGGFGLRTFWKDPDGRPEEHEYLLPGAARDDTRTLDPVAAEALEMALDLFHFDAVHIQHLKGHSFAALDVLARFEGPVLYSVRDLYLACPNYSLLYLDREACGIPDDLTYCRTCLPETRRQDLDHLLEFRASVAERLDVVDRWVCASQSTADFLLRAYDIDADRIALIAHGAIIDPGRRRPAMSDELVFGEPLRLAFVGRAWAKKGLGVVNQLAEDLADTDIEFHHFGPVKEQPSAAIRAHGPYDNQLLPELLDRAGIQIVLLPGPYAETFGHVMTESMLAGRPVIGASYGALGERIRRRKAGWTVDPVDVPAIRDLVVRLDAERAEIRRAGRNAATAAIDSVAATAPHYADLYRLGKGADAVPEPVAGGSR